MTAISNRQPEVNVEYDTTAGRSSKHFTNVYAARRFYTKQFKLGNNPQVRGANSMSTTTTKTKPAKKTATKKAPAKKKALKRKPKVSAKATPNGKQSTKRSDDLRKPQVRILEYLAKQSKPRTRAEISEGADCDLAMLNSYIGAHDDAKRAANDKKNYPCLRTLKYVKVEQEDVDGRDVVVHSITSTGKKALAKYPK